MEYDFGTYVSGILKIRSRVIIQDGGGRDFNIDFLNSEYDSLSYWGKQENIYNMLMYNHY